MRILKSAYATTNAINLLWHSIYVLAVSRTKPCKRAGLADADPSLLEPYYTR